MENAHDGRSAISGAVCLVVRIPQLQYKRDVGQYSIEREPSCLQMLSCPELSRPSMKFRHSEEYGKLVFLFNT